MAGLFQLSGPPRITLDDDTVIDLPYPQIDNFMYASAGDETEYKTYNTGARKRAGQRRLRPNFRFQLCGLTTDEAETIQAALEEGEFSFTPRTKIAGDAAEALEVSCRVRVAGNIPFSDRVQRQELERIDMAIELESIEKSIVSRQGILIVTIETGNAGGPDAGAQEAFKDDSIALVTPQGATSTLIECAATPIRADFNPYDGRYYYVQDDGDFRSCAGYGNDDALHFSFAGTILDMFVCQDGPNKGDVYVLENFGAGDDRLYRWTTRATTPAMVHLNSSSVQNMGAVAMCHNTDVDEIGICGTAAGASIWRHSMETVGNCTVLNTNTRPGASGITYIHGKLLYFVHDGELKVTSATSPAAYTDHSLFVASGPLYYDILTGRIYMDGASMFYTFPEFGVGAVNGNQSPTEAQVGLYDYRSISVHR